MSATAAAYGSYAVNDTTQATQVLRVQITVAGNYGSSGTHGDILNLATVYGVQGTKVVSYYIEEMPPAGTAPTGTLWGYALGTTLANGKLTAFTTYNSEYTQGSAYTAAQKAAVIIGVFHLTTFQ